MAGCEHYIEREKRHCNNAPAEWHVHGKIDGTEFDLKCCQLHAWEFKKLLGVTVEKIQPGKGRFVMGDEGYGELPWFMKPARQRNRPIKFASDYVQTIGHSML
jgi:hypothetical protein